MALHIGLRGVINGAARHLGLRVSLEPTIETPFRSDRVTRNVRPGVIVEFVGPTCVGKSTLLRHLHLTNDESDGFSFLNERRRIRTERSLNRRISELDPNLKLLWQSKFGDRHSTRKEKLAKAPPSLGHNRLSLLMESSIRSHISSETLLIDHSLSAFFRYQLRTIQLRDPDLFETLMSRRCVVICTCDPHLNVERVLHQRKKGIPNRFHDNSSLEESLTLATNAQSNWTEYGDWLESVGVPVLRLDLGRPLKESKERLKEFLSALD